MVKATKAVKTKTKAATKRGKAPQISKPGRGRGREVDPSVRVRWRAEEDALVERLRGEGQTWPQIAEAVSRLGTQRGSAACMQRMIYLAAKRERGTLTLAPRSDGRIEVDVNLFGQVIHVTTSRTLEQILGYLAGAA
jgi:hypothetical protein